ncbi:MAG: 23S rRNA (uracil(1939)-C(5))-methyltransferase RlmD [Emcibacteraceae bacterium]
MTQKITIDELGGRGDGIAHMDGKTVYVPYTVSGDVIDAKLNGPKGRLRHIHIKSPYRAEPICQHFGDCGGCMLQHVEKDYYRDWKRNLVKTALENQGIADAEIRPLEISPIGSRRRTSFHAIGRGSGEIILGYAEKGSHNLVDINMCPIQVPQITSFIEPLKKYLRKNLGHKQKMTIQITKADNGLDVVFKGNGEVDLNMRMDLAAFAEENDLARISWFDTKLKKPFYEILAERRKPFVTFEGNKVFFPEGAFLQATEHGQNVLISAMLDGIKGATRVVDLFSGCGTFSIAAANHANVHAVENNEEMLEALKSSANQLGGIKRVTTELRDLFLRPLLPHELDNFDVAIIDPPRAGARHQMVEIINSKLKKLVMVSCNPVTFSRDVQNLIEAGFKMGAVTPVDQFLYSAHLEIIATFERA